MARSARFIAIMAIIRRAPYRTAQRALAHAIAETRAWDGADPALIVDASAAA
ncbi:hypothetical protein [Burkholderia diffusa]|uniref:hypothetical protein n=1 Tax=Burkholderia diffusa TaxID=488732 RepID=UPI0012D8EA7A|nr:hypothetical protein [Burkholderia diffusa]